jgi:hypothetical protein
VKRSGLVDDKTHEPLEIQAFDGTYFTEIVHISGNVVFFHPAFVDYDDQLAYIANKEVDLWLHAMSY